MQIFSLILSLVAAIFLLNPEEKNSSSNIPAADSASAEISFLPKEIIVDQPKEGFVVKEVSVLNNGSAPLEIFSVTPSCGCASAAVMENPIPPMGMGKIRLSVNTKKFSDSLNRVEYIIRSNATNSTVAYYLIVRGNSRK